MLYRGYLVQNLRLYIKTCDCQVAQNCPLNGNCKQSAVIDQADVTPEIDNEYTYAELTEGPFKERLSDHLTSLKYEPYKYKSKLYSFIWEMKNKGQNFEIKWSVIRRSNPYKAGSKNVICVSGKSSIS